MRHRTRAWACLLVGLVGLCGTAFTQETDPGKDLAEARKAAAEARAAADKPGDVATVSRSFDLAVERYETCLAHPDQPGREDVLMELGILLHREAVFLVDRMESSEQPAPLRDAAAKAIERSSECLRGARDRYKAKWKASRGDDTAADWAARRAGFYLVLCPYNLARVHPAGSAERRVAAGTAIERLEAFIWDNEANILGGYAQMYLGLCYETLDLPDETVEWFRAAVSGPVPDAGKHPEKYRLWTDLHLQAYFKLGEACNRFGKRGAKEYRDALDEAIPRMTKRIPDAGGRRFGQMAMLEHGKSLLVREQYHKALGVWGDLNRQPKDEGVTYLADRLLAEILAASGGSGAGPELLFRAAGAEKLSRRFADAAKLFRAAAEACKSDAEVREYGVPSWMEVGECLYRQEKYREALAIYERVIRDYVKIDPENAGDAAYYAYRSATAIHHKSRTPADGELKRKMRLRFAEQFPKHPRALDLAYYEGADLIAAADGKLAAGDKDAAKKVYADAVFMMRRVSNASTLHEKARARIGEILFKTEDYEGALAEFGKLTAELRNPRRPSTDRQRIAHRDAAWALADYYSARCNEKLGRWQEVVSGLEGFEERHAGPTARAFLVAVRYERAQALVALGRFGDAEKVILTFRPDSENRADLVRLRRLLRQLIDADPARRYSHSWWRWQVMLFKACQTSYGLGDEDARERIVTMYVQLKELGVLSNAPFRDELREIYDGARDR